MRNSADISTALGHFCSEKKNMAMKSIFFFFLLWISVSTVFGYVSIKLGIGYRSGVAPCHYSCSACSAFQGGWQKGGNYLVTHEHQVSSLEEGVSKHCLLVHFINWKTLCVWLTPDVLYTLVAPDHSFKHGLSLIIFLLLCPQHSILCRQFHCPVPFQPLNFLYLCLPTQCAGNAVSEILYELLWTFVMLKWLKWSINLILYGVFISYMLY